MVALRNIMHHNKKPQEMTICCLDKGVLPFPRGSYICVMEKHTKGWQRVYGLSKRGALMHLENRILVTGGNG
jgi:hypothetical protein